MNNLYSLQIGQKESKLGNLEVNEDERFKSYQELIDIMDKFPKDLDFDVVFFIDFSKSNLWGDLHGINSENSIYYRMIQSLKPFLQHCKKEQIYHCYRFGDITTRDLKVLPLNSGMIKPQSNELPPRQLEEDEYYGLDHLLQGYKVAKNNIQMSGPSCLCPSLEQTCKIQQGNKPLIGIYISDAEFTFQLYDFQQIVIASNQPISIIIIDIDSDVNEQTQAYDTMVGRKFDNVNYFNINEIGQQFQNKPQDVCLKIFMEIPDQFGAMCKLGYLGQRGKEIIETVEYQLNSKSINRDIEDVEISIQVGKLWKEVTAQNTKIKIDNNEPEFQYKDWLSEKPHLFTAYAFLDQISPILVIYQQKQHRSQELVLQISNQQIQEIKPEQQIQNFFQVLFNSAPSANQLRKLTHIPSNYKVKQVQFKQVKILLNQLEQVWKQNTFNDKVGVMLQLEGQKTEEEMLSCKLDQMSDNFKQFLQVLGDQVEMNGFKAYNGGLDIKGRESPQSIYYKEGNYETMFHVCPMLKYAENDPEQVVRKRHIGNDHIVIIYQDSDNCVFSSTAIRSNMIMLYIVVKKAQNGYDIKIVAKQYIETGDLQFCQHIEGDQKQLQQQMHQILKECHKAVWLSGELQQKLERLHTLKLQDCVDNRLTE